MSNKKEKGLMYQLEDAIFSDPSRKAAYDNLMKGMKTYNDIADKLPSSASSTLIVCYWETAEDGDKYLHQVHYWNDVNEITHVLTHEDMVRLDGSFSNVFHERHYNRGLGFYPLDYLKNDEYPHIRYEDELIGDVANEWDLETLHTVFNKLMSKYKKD